MQIELRESCDYALLVPTSMGVRMTPLGGQPVHCSDTFTLKATSAETNVASVSSYLGLPVKVLTSFVKDNPFAQFIKDNLASRHMDYEGKEIDQGGPWGYRHQINFADSGYGSRGPRVQNDRAGEVGLIADEERIVHGRGSASGPAARHSQLLHHPPEPYSRSKSSNPTCPTPCYTVMLRPPLRTDHDPCWAGCDVDRRRASHWSRTECRRNLLR